MNREELLAGVVEAPTDDGPRLVYADWLLQQNDPADRARGEYISLAVAQARSPKRTSRLKELLDKHEAVWLGDVLPLLDTRRRVWSRGFLEACAFHRNVAAPTAAALGHATWRTLRTLEMFGSPQPLAEQLAILRQPELANLKALYAYQTSLRPLAESDCALRISELAVAPAGPPLADLIDVLRAPCFERVRRLHVFGCSPDLGCAFSRKELTLIAVAAPSTLAAWLMLLTATSAVFDEVRLVSSVFPLMARHGVELVLRRADSGQWSALEIRWDDDNEPRLRDNVILELGRLPEGAITHLQLVGPPTARFDVSRWKTRVRAALIPRQPNLVVT